MNRNNQREEDSRASKSLEVSFLHMKPSLHQLHEFGFSPVWAYYSHDMRTEFSLSSFEILF